MKTAHERHDLLKNLSKRFQQLQVELGEIGEHVVLRCDRWALRGHLTLAWDVENTFVVGEHQAGRRLEDDMFYPEPGKPRPMSGARACAVPLDECLAFASPTRLPMDKHQRRAGLVRIAGEIRDSIAQLEELQPQLALARDRWAIDNTIRSLREKARRCDVIADHQIGLALDTSTGGYWFPSDLPHKDRPSLRDRTVPAGSSVEQLNRDDYEASERSA